jgi:hypothetical protein
LCHSERSEESRISSVSETNKRKAKAGAPGRRTRRDLLDQAQELIYDAWETADHNRRVALAHSRDNPWSRQALAAALETNPHVPGYLLGHSPLPQELPGYTGIGDESEAAYWAVENIKAWQTTYGALTWLAERIVVSSA